LRGKKTNFNNFNRCLVEAGLTISATPVAATPVAATKGATRAESELLASSPSSSASSVVVVAAAAKQTATTTNAGEKEEGEQGSTRAPKERRVPRQHNQGKERADAVDTAAPFLPDFRLRKQQQQPRWLRSRQQQQRHQFAPSPDCVVRGLDVLWRLERILAPPPPFLRHWWQWWRFVWWRQQQQQPTMPTTTTTAPTAPIQRGRLLWWRLRGWQLRGWRLWSSRLLLSTC